MAHPIQESLIPEPPKDMVADAQARREKLKERLKQVRENPRPEPLPATAAEAGSRAVERIASLQKELTELRALNLALTQDLEAARRQSERATEEARLRHEEASRLSGELERRVTLLGDLERELAALEAERDEALLALQDARQDVAAVLEQKKGLEGEISRRDASLAESIAEEERLAAELEAAKDESLSLRGAVEALTQERDTLARQVADLTRERGDLLEARRALEAVHRALSHATVR